MSTEIPTAAIPLVEFRSAVSGMWYRNPKAAGTVDAVRQFVPGVGLPFLYEFDIDRDSDAQGLVPERSEGPNDSEPVAARAEGIAQQAQKNPVVSKEIIDAGQAMAKVLRNSRDPFMWAYSNRWDAALSKANLGEGMSELTNEEIDRLANECEQYGIDKIWGKDNPNRPKHLSGGILEAISAGMLWLRDKGYLSRSVEEEPVKYEQVGWMNEEGSMLPEADIEHFRKHGRKMLYYTIPLYRKVDAQ